MKNVNTSQILNTSRDVLYGSTQMQQSEWEWRYWGKNVTNNFMNRTLTNLESKLVEMKTRVVHVEYTIKNFKSRCDVSVEQSTMN